MLLKLPGEVSSCPSGIRLFCVLWSPNCDAWLDNYITTALFQVPAVCVEVQVTGSANMVTFQPYYHGAAPVRLVNDCHFKIAFGQKPE